MTSNPLREGGTIMGLDNVQVDLPLAGIGSRSLAAAIDHLILLLLQILWIIACSTLAGFELLQGAWIAVAMTAGFFLLQWGYFALLEINSGGKTPGKSLLGLRVVSHVGGRASAAALLIRNFVRTFDLLVGVPLMALDRRSRRLGDMLATTLVIHEEKVPEGHVQVSRYPSSWGGKEVALVEGFLTRAPYLEADKAQQMADQLLGWIQQEDPKFWADIESDIVWSGDRVLVLTQVVQPA